MTPLLDSKLDRAVIFLAFGLSLSLFGLTILEEIPISTPTLLSHQWALVFAYWITLWLLSIYILFVVPFLVGASAVNSLRRIFCSTISSRKNTCSFFDATKLLRWIEFVLRFGFGLIFIILKRIIYKGLTWCISGRRQDVIEESIMRSPSEEVYNKSPPVILPTNVKHSSVNSSSSTCKNRDYSSYLHTSRQQVLFGTIGGIFGITLVFEIFKMIGPLVVQPPSTHETSILFLIVSRICALGLLISSIMNGFGSVSLPFTTISGLSLQVRPEYITKLEGDLKSIREILVKKQNTLKELKVEIPKINSIRSTSQSSASGCSGNIFSKSSLLLQNKTSCGFSDIGVELRKRRQKIITEIRFIEDLVRETALDLEELKCSQMTAASTKTTIGKIKTCIGLGFSIILLIRLFAAGFYIFRICSKSLNRDHVSHLHRKSRSDIVTSILIWLAGPRHVSNNQYSIISQIVSLSLSTVLSFTQVTNFFRTANSAHRQLSRFQKHFFCGDEKIDWMKPSSKTNVDKEANTYLLWHVTSAFLGCYSLACIVLIKMMLPERFSIAFSMALNETSIFTIHNFAPNTIFFSTAIMTSAIFGMLLGIRRQNISKHAYILSHKGLNSTNITLPDV
mmetsp:Transcript_23147/g.54733  ORF Transcript_23147/g.54733 Transcript_23147/m.54733 type:complete len:621 (-) Transcript_23147:22-1884(-)